VRDERLPLRCLFSLGLWLEYSVYTNASVMDSPYSLALSDDITVPGGGEKTKETAQNIFGQKVLKADKFKTGGLLGSHSIRKFAAEYQEMTREGEADGRDMDESLIAMMIWNCPIQTVKQMRLCVWAAHATM
jgi:hypothetical protein